MSDKNKIQYRRVGDYIIPNLTILPEEANISLGTWGMLHKDYLLKYKKAVFTTLLANGKLYQHCYDVEKQAQHTFDALVKQMRTAKGVSEQLKEKEQIVWVRLVQNIEEKAREIVYEETIYN